MIQGRGLRIVRLETPRLVLRPVEMADDEAIFEAFTAAVTRYMHPCPAHDIGETREFITRAIAGNEAGTELQFAVCSSAGEFLGCIGVHGLDRSDPELGIWLKKEAQGLGLGTEAAAAVVSWSRENLDFSHVLYPVDRRNFASRRIPESLGGRINREYRSLSQSQVELDLLEYWIPRTPLDPRAQARLDRLSAIGRSLEKTGKARALLGLGSVGVELSRLDAYSDLDFFAIVKDGCKREFLEDLTWLTSIRPLAYCFRNTVDGYKALFDDKIFLEFAVFECHELERIPYAEGRIVWCEDGFDQGLRVAKNPGGDTWKPDSADWLLGEIVTCLYVGLCRARRGERLSAWRFVEGHAFSLLMELWRLREVESPSVQRDAYAKERRFESRYPQLQAQIGGFLQGYDRVNESARAMIEYLNAHFAVNPAMFALILELAID